jgi:hypothetical protein
MGGHDAKGSAFSVMLLATDALPRLWDRLVDVQDTLSYDEVKETIRENLLDE